MGVLDIVDRLPAAPQHNRRLARDGVRDTMRQRIGEAGGEALAWRR